MITLRRAHERHHEQRPKWEVWHTFYPKDHVDELADGFGAIERLSEEHLRPGADVPRQPHRDAEIVTYMIEGAIAQEDMTGRTGILHTGEFQRRTADRRVRHRERNASQVNGAHILRVSLRSSGPDRDNSQEQKHFSAAERRGVLCIVASPDGRKGSLGLHQDVRIYSALLDVGKHLVHELLRDRIAWLHVLHGQVLFDELILGAGEGVGVSGERAVSLTARAETEILLFDLKRPPKNGGPS